MPLLPGPLWSGVVAPDMGQIELNCVLTLSWIVRNRTVLLFWHVYYVLMLNWIIWNRTVSLNRIAWNRNFLTLLMLKWIVWNRTDYLYKNGFGIKMTNNGWYAIKPKQPTIALCPVDWGCRIHRLLLCRGVRPHPPTSVLDMTLNNLMVRFQWCSSFRECVNGF